jgi:7,8-dihydropterin-6-yl-methyl-4-(beta-D-ribofuranosyl)aminobenzene 5'-phosphate synthase
MSGENSFRRSVVEPQRVGHRVRSLRVIVLSTMLAGNPGERGSSDGLVEDTVPEDSSLIFDTERGFVLLSGCGHAGIINTLDYARNKIRPERVYAAVGGFHLFQLGEERLDWTASKLREFGVKYLLGGHCTGIEAVYRLRRQIGLTREECVVSAVGSSFTLDKGIDPLLLAR